MVGYFEEQAVISYTEYLEQIDAGKAANIDAPDIAKHYYGLDRTAKLRDVIIAVRRDEQGHSDTNHEMADALAKG
jgi:ubiquinol oxidase